MKMLLRYMSPYKWKTIISFAIRIIGILSELALPYVLSHILKNVIESQRVSLVLFWGCIMILCAAISFVSNLTANRIVAGVARNVSENLRHDLFSKTIRLSAKCTDRFTIASLESRVTTDTYHIHNFIRLVQIIGIRAPLLLIGGIVITMSMDAFLSSVMLIIMPVMFLVVYIIMKRGIPLYTKVQNAVDNMVRVVREDTQGIRVIKALSKDEYEHKRFDKVNSELVKEEVKANVIMSATNPIMTLSMNLGMAAVVALSATRIANYQSDPETIIVFMQYFTQISMSMMMLTRLFVMSSKCSASAKRIDEVLQCEDELKEASTDEYPVVDTDVFVEFDNVTFSYEGKKPDVENISFKLYKGQSLGIIGATGSGKSTIIKLLLRFYDADSGS
ncbi:MAG: ABC transporter ATP-binding protein, partial [Clostridia bacterium]|nr:ABC transporter ATP-binding protein [Clostridia bacterium]